MGKLFLFDAFFNRISVHDGDFNKKAAWIITLALLLCLPSIFSGLFADDYSQALLAQNFFAEQSEYLIAQPNTPTLANLFTFVTTDELRREQLIEHSLLPWWTAPNFSMMFFRPLAELSHLFDYGVLTNPILMHLHSLLWYGLLLWALAGVFKRLLPVHLSLLALLFFALDSTHAFTVAWLANRNAIMAMVFSLCALNALDEYVKHYNVKSLVAMVLCVLLAFLSAEAGIVVGVFLLAYVLFYCQDSRALKRAIWPMLCAFIVFVIWLYFYHSQGFGASGNKAYYADPIAEPLYYLQTLPQRFLLAIAMLFNLLPFHLNPQWSVFCTAVGLFILLLLSVFVAKRRKAYLYFASFVMCLSILPVASAEMQARNLLFASMGASILLADLLACAFQYIKQSSHAGFMKRKATLLFLWLMFSFHLFFSGLLILPMSYAPAVLAGPAKKSLQALDASVLDARHAVASAYSSQLIFTVGLPLFSSAYIVPMQAYYLPPSDAGNKPLSRVFMNVSSDANARFKWRKPEAGFAYSFLVESDTGLFSGPDTLLRNVSIDPFEEGDRLYLSFGRVEILKLNDAGAVLSLGIDIQQNDSFSIQEDDIGLYYWKNKPDIQFVEHEKAE